MALTLISQPPALGLSHNPSIWRLQSDETTEDNLRVDVTIKQGQATIGQDSAPADSAGICAFEISEYFKSILNPVFLFPDGDIPRYATGNFAIFGLTFEEFYGAPPIEDTQIDVQEYYVVYGRIPAYLHTWFYRNYTSFLNYLTTTHNFLTFWPSTHYVSKAQTEKLFFCYYWPEEGDSLYMLVTLKFKSGTRVTRTPMGSPIGPVGRPYHVVEFHVGHNALGLDAYMAANYPDETLESYDVEIGKSPTVAVSSKHTYILDETNYPQRREFIFRNSLGGYDTFVATGKTQQSGDYEPEIITVLPWYGIQGNARKTIRTAYEETVECNSGFVSAETMAAMPQFFESDDAYEIISGKLYPIGFPKQQIIRKTDRQGMYYFQFTYNYLPIHKIETAS
jgi:hypothetical protein